MDINEKQEETLTAPLEVPLNPVVKETYEFKVNKKALKLYSSGICGALFAAMILWSFYQSLANKKQIDGLLKNDHSYLYQASSNVIILRPTRQP